MQEILFLVPEVISQSFWISWSLILCGFMILFLILIYFWSLYLQQQKLEKKLFFPELFSEKKEVEKLKKLKLPKNKYLKYFVESYILLDTKISWKSFLILIFIISLGFGIFIGQQKKSLFLGNLIFISLFIIFIIFVFFKASDKKHKLVEQIPTFLQAMGSAMQAGYSIQNAFYFIAEEIDQPLKSQVVKINQKLKLQISLESALKDFAQTVKNPEVDFFTESTIIQIKTGGNLVKLFEKISYLIEEKLKLKRDIKSFTSQGKMSGIMIASLWPLSLVIFSWLSPEHTAILFETSKGQILLFISLSLEAIGFFFIWKIISVKI